MAGAAFFDLDRTLLQGASGPVMSDALRSVGVITSAKTPIEDALFGVFDLVGETRPSMMLARLGVRFSKGWDAERVAEAGQSAAEQLVPMIQPYARQLIEWHRLEGRKVVMATTSPMTMCGPLAELLELDDVIATSYGVKGGKYDGTVDGHYVWGPGKRDAVKEWSEANDVDLDDSYAYSDSRYDLPLLRSVGHAVAVNPDPRLKVLATGLGWPVLYLDVPAGVPKVAGVEPVEAAMSLVRPELTPYARFDIDGTDFIPKTGPAILAANHRSYFDPLVIAFALARAGRSGRFMAKKEVVDAPIIGSLVKSAGTIRVDRGSGSSGPLDAAASALEAGEVVVILPQGTIPRGHDFFDPVLHGRPGVAKLAVMTGAPVIPLGLFGSEEVWPRSAKLPAVWNVTAPPRVRVRVGEAVDLSALTKGAKTTKKTGRKSVSAKKETAIVAEIMSSIVDLLPDEAREEIEPTEEQLARTQPSGKSSAKEAAVAT